MLQMSMKWLVRCVKVRAKMITINDVARRAQVAPTTVSHALSGKRHVAAATRARILAAARDLDYHPNAAARSLSLRRTSMVALALPLEFYAGALPEGRFQGFIAHTADCLNAYNYKLLCLISRDPEPADEAEAAIADEDGAVDIGRRVAEQEERGVDDVGDRPEPSGGDGRPEAFADLARLFENLGFRPVAAVRKRRTMIPEPGDEAAGPESTGRSRAPASA